MNNRKLNEHIMPHGPYLLYKKFSLIYHLTTKPTNSTGISWTNNFLIIINVEMDHVMLIFFNIGGIWYYNNQLIHHMIYFIVEDP